MGKTTEDSLEDRLWKLQREVDPDDIRLEPILLAIAELDRQGGRLVRARARAASHGDAQHAARPFPSERSGPRRAGGGSAMGAVMVIIEECQEPVVWRKVQSIVGTATACHNASELQALLASEPDTLAVTACPLERAAALELTRNVRARHPALHVVFVSPSSDPTSVAEAFAAGASDHCAAPTPDELVARLRAGQSEPRNSDGEHTRGVTAARPWRALGETVQGSLQEMIGSTLVREPGDSIDDAVAFATTITLVAPALGVELGLGLVASREAANACALLMFGEAADDATLADLVGELANIAAGAVKNAMAVDNVALVLRIPKRESAASVAAAARAFGERQNCRMAIGGGGLRLWAGVRWRGTRQLRMRELLENMVLAEDIRSAVGALVIAGGTRLTATMAKRLAAFSPDSRVGVCVL
jgi:CheY-like chemotaxis protein